jgi:hypothetical protein
MASSAFELSTAYWRKSSYSNASGGDCVEVAPVFPGVVPVRYSKQAAEEGAVLLFEATTWTTFLSSLKS